ncbi:hypothetical protein L1987_63646 [Smallanthus sonchifolius]|uniref:Uncharacterized protein n=1 Tax=Smallanthus sonchifolius TaxID=185202 RepID=A0ACB9CDV2_9ASTR|nr:hypothetical protein L1987_63646 [Smallanthus sonchifolius]
MADLPSEAFVQVREKEVIFFILRNILTRFGIPAEIVDRTTAKNVTGQTPFSLVFGTEAMIPMEMAIPTVRTNLQTPESNNEALAQDLDTVGELKDLA